ncbi:MAG: hypothetical protein Harvfovirus37_19 [Harvfovirus sp.]|uniref:Uncharacterized protein n=1 Tax=Harvfovirus sp. TaxID=2487768 RepID=A0A3G5A2T0_9VIRU|nr:MAG: hypothetical protein Harvfovirus37_19 [Harvfovirus sp.]
MSEPIHVDEAIAFHTKAITAHQRLLQLLIDEIQSLDYGGFALHQKRLQELVVAKAAAERKAEVDADEEAEREEAARVARVLTAWAPYVRNCLLKFDDFDKNIIAGALTDEDGLHAFINAFRERHDKEQQKLK